MKSRILNNFAFKSKYFPSHASKCITTTSHILYNRCKTSNIGAGTKIITAPSNHQQYSLFSTESKTQDGVDIKTEESLNHCINLVQKRDKAGYLTTLLLPHTARSSVFSIRAFNIELASIKDNSSTNSSTSNAEVLTGSTAHIPFRIRFQFWRDVLDQIYNDTNAVNVKFYTENNPLIHLLQKSIYDNKLTRRFLEKMIDAREYDLDVQQFDSLQDVVNYGEDTFGSLYYLSLECMNVSQLSLNKSEYSCVCSSHFSS